MRLDSERNEVIAHDHDRTGFPASTLFVVVLPQKTR